MWNTFIYAGNGPDFDFLPKDNKTYIKHIKAAKMALK